MFLGVQRSPKPIGVHPPEIVLTPIDEDHGDLLGVLLHQLEPTGDVDFVEVLPTFGANNRDHRPRGVTKVTSRPAQQLHSAHSGLPELTTAFRELTQPHVLSTIHCVKSFTLRCLRRVSPDSQSAYHLAMPAVHSLHPSGLEALRRALVPILGQPLLATAASTSGVPPSRKPGRSVADDQLPSGRVAALVDLARRGDAEAFGALYDHYNTAVYRFIYFRVNSTALAEDLVSETFFRALRSMSSFQWQGKDFGAWLMTIARNLVIDHYKSGRTRLETVTNDFTGREGHSDGPETEVLAELTSDILRTALSRLPAEQQECLVLRFLSGCSIAETAKALGRSEGAVKQLQLRAIRNLAKILPEGLR